MTPRQQEVYNFIVQHIAEKAYALTVREIGCAVGHKSSSTTNGYIHRLAKLGVITHTPGSARSIVVVSDKHPESPEFEVIKLRNGQATLIRYKDHIFTLFKKAKR